MAAFALVACGGGSGSDKAARATATTATTATTPPAPTTTTAGLPADQAVRSAADRLVQAGTGRYTVEVQFGGEGLGGLDDLVYVEHVTYDIPAQRIERRMVLPEEIADALAAEAPGAPDLPAGDRDNPHVTILWAMGHPPLFRSMTLGDKWVSFPEDAVEDAAASFGLDMSQASVENALPLVQTFRQSTPALRLTEDYGREQQFEGTVGFGDVNGLLSGSALTRLLDAVPDDQLEEFLGEPVDVRVTTYDGVLSRLSADLTSQLVRLLEAAPRESVPAGLRESVRLRFDVRFGFTGDPVNLELPPPNEIARAEDIGVS